MSSLVYLCFSLFNVCVCVYTCGYMYSSEDGVKSEPWWGHMHLT